MTAVKVLIGDEPVQLRSIFKDYRSRAGAWEIVSAAETAPGVVMTASLFSDPEAPLIRVLEDYAKWTSAQRKTFAEMTKTIPSGLVLLIPVRQLGAKDPLRAALPSDSMVQIAPPKSGSFDAWVDQYAKSQGIKIERNVAHLLVERLGESTERLSNEVMKLACLDMTVTTDHVRALTQPEADFQSWTWVEALVNGNRKQVFEELGKLETSSLTPLALTGGLSSRLLTMAWVHAGCSPESVNSKPYPWQKATQATRSGWNLPRVRRALARVARYEGYLRGNSQLPEWVLISRMCAEQLSDR